MNSARRRFLAAAVLLGAWLPAAGHADQWVPPAPDLETRPTGTVEPLAQMLLERRVLFGPRRDLLALRWKHELSEEHSVWFTAGHGEDPYLEEAARESVSTMASFSWTGQWSGRLHPSVSGSLFAGDESPDDEFYRSHERRYYGLAVGGRLRLFERHSPFLSLRVLRSEEVAEPFDPGAPQYSRLTAGWDWQIRPNWRVRAEADYTLYDDPSLSLYRYDRTSIFFSTRFDFR